ncbi:MAG: response regulator [Thermodesulfobacteriaceae bacterium]|nr:response regulator [Thermodesulfobacteriaceae bacterium]MCX8042047.1 response regulator [Thermodesulfobacteriaceae bacterium]MDW8136129.1 response regulator [Thermodesulfobacterium sp.]
MFWLGIEQSENIKVLVVEDDDEVRTAMVDFLIKEGYEVYSAKNGIEGFRKVLEVEPDVVLIDYLMPGMDGISLCKAIKNNSETVDIGVILITGVDDLEIRINGLEAGADDFLSKPFLIPELKARIRSLSKIKKYRDFLKSYQETLESEVERKTSDLLKAHLELKKAYEEIKELSLEIIYRLAKAAEYKDEYTGFHIQRISAYCVKMAESLGLNKEQIDLLKYGSPLHDIGKLGIPEKILIKPGILDEFEREIIKKHTLIGFKILEGSKIKYLQVAEKIALFHHERWDGTGYPYGLRGKKIPLFARITAIADVFDALTTDRPYRRALSISQALEIIKHSSGTHFDPELVNIFFKIKDQIIEIRNFFKDEDPKSDRLFLKFFL